MLASWKMSFQSVHFLIFLPLVAGVFFLLPKRLRRVWLLVASYYFYFFAAPRYLLVLVGGTLFAYLFGLAIGRAKTPRAKHGWLAGGIIGLTGLLCFFKYNAFFATFLAPFFGRMGIDYNANYFTTAAAIGISFYVFTAIGYLVDTARGDTPPEKNILTFALFLGFFPSITSGPISRAGGLLPQLQYPDAKADAGRIAEALRMMGIGFFKKLAVADMLAVFSTAMFSDATRTGLSLLLATVVFTLQLYFDFAGYTDIARGTALLFGITLPQNFNTPYFATNFSGFWARWHMSLSAWLQDYLFTPLVWSRWTGRIPLIGKLVKKPPVLSSLAIVFLVSGLWHGDTLCFLVWGALQAAYRIGEELLHRHVGKPQKKPSARLRLGKNAVVLVLWGFSLVFFRVGMLPGGSLRYAFGFLGRVFASFSPALLWTDITASFGAAILNTPFAIAIVLTFTVFCTVLALVADRTEYKRLKGTPLSTGIAALPALPRWALYYAIVLCSFGAFLLQGGESFLYGGF